jgi:hypothetical protein
MRLYAWIRVSFSTSRKSDEGDDEDHLSDNNIVRDYNI